jgi:hypothetical protein
VAAGTAIFHAAVAMFPRAFLLVVARLQRREGGCRGAELPLHALLDELIDACAHLGGEIVRNAIAARLAADRLRAGGAE